MCMRFYVMEIIKHKRNIDLDYFGCVKRRFDFANFKIKFFF
jgi:hypothetical protein